MNIAAYIPCYNNRDAIVKAITSLHRQTHPPEELLVVDDGSTDGSETVAKSLGARVVRFGKNLGRGAARARAMKELTAEFVVSCDATVSLIPEFIERALNHFENDKTAAVFGRIIQPQGGGAITRWRGRHLFKLETPPLPSKALKTFISSCALVRRRAVMDCGNYDQRLRYAEDGDLGRRLISAGWTIWYDSELRGVCTVENTLGQVLERYWRWNAFPGSPPTLRGYLRDIWFSVKVMAAADLRVGDPAAAAISLLCPHYRFLKTLKTSFGSRKGKQ